jgi:hypothetical protein
VKRLAAFAAGTLIVLVIVAWLALLWFAGDWFSASCDPQVNYNHCSTSTGSGPGGK